MKKIDLVYIIEDDPIASYVIKTLVDTNPSVKSSIAFENGLLALNVLANSFISNAPLPDMILLDINMPIMDAWEFLDALKLLKNYKQIPIYILSSSVDPNDIEKSKNYEMVQGFMSKPLSEKKLNNLF